MWVVVKIRVPFGVPIKNTAPIIQGTRKGPFILTTTHVALEDLEFGLSGFWVLKLGGSVVFGLRVASLQRF